MTAVLVAADVSGDGRADVCVGRDDGSFEVYGFEGVMPGSPPRLIFSTELGESVTAIEHGQFIALHTASQSRSQCSADIVVATYSGQIMLFECVGTGAARADLVEESTTVASGRWRQR